MNSRNLPPIAILLLAAWLYIPLLSLPLTYDEAFTFIHYSQDIIRTFVDYSAPNNHILHSGLVWSMIQIDALRITNAPTASTSGNLDNPARITPPHLIRLPAFAAALIALALIYRIALRSLPPLAASFACLWLALMPSFINYATTARGYSLTIALALALWWVTVEHATPQSARVAFWLTFASILTLPTMILLIAPLGLWALISHRRRILAPLIMGTLAGGLFYLPAFYFGAISNHMHQFGYRLPSDLINDTSVMAWAPMLMAVLLISTLASQPQRKECNATVSP